MPLQPLVPPQNFEPAGDVLNQPPARENLDFDEYPVENSAKAVRSRGLFIRFSQKEPSITAQPTNPTDYVWVGNKTWRRLSEWIGTLIDEAVAGITISWDDIDKPANLATTDDIPNVPFWVQSITQAQKEALAWFTSKFPRTKLNPGDVLIIGPDGDSIVPTAMGQILSGYFPALSGVLSGVVSPPTSVFVRQVATDVEIVWTDIVRRAGYYGVEVRYKINNGEWSDWEFLNQPDYSQRSHTWPREFIPNFMTDVDARVRYIDAQNAPSAWIDAQTKYNEDKPVVTEITYEVVEDSVRWWSDGGVLETTQYEIVPGSVRFYSEEEIDEPDPTPPVAPNPITVKRFAFNIIDVTVSDNNSGVDHYEYNYREKNTAQWYTLKADGSLSTNPTGPLLVTFADNISTRLNGVAATYFIGKQIEVRVRTWVNDEASPWSNIVAEAAADTPTDFVTLSKSVRTAKINIQKDEDDLYSDTESDVDGIYLAYYYVNGRPYKDGSGNRKKFENEAFSDGLLIEVSKIFVDPGHFTSWTVLEDSMYIAQMGSGGTPAWIHMYAQQNFITQ